MARRPAAATPPAPANEGGDPPDPLDAPDVTAPEDAGDASIGAAVAPEPAGDTRRARLGLGAELSLAALPTLTVVSVLWLVEAFADREVLFASLASSAFLIYRDPEHRMNSVTVLVVAQVLAAAIGFAIWSWLGSSYLSAALALALATFAMVALDAVHPPAVGTALTFAFRPGDDSDLALFLLALLLVVLLAGLSLGVNRMLRWLLHRDHGAR